MEQDRDARNKPTHLQSAKSQQKHQKIYVRERSASSINGAGKSEESSAEE
jgi:hypothetical protein